jgi:hypothetical protein
MSTHQLTVRATSAFVLVLAFTIPLTAASAQSDSALCESAVRTAEVTSPRVADLELFTNSCAHHAARLRAVAIRTARTASADQAVRLAALRVLATGIRSELSVSREWLAAAHTGDMIPRSAHRTSSPAVEAADRDVVWATLSDLAQTATDAEIRKASLVLLQGLVIADPDFARVAPESATLTARCGDRVRFETTSEVSVPYVVMVEGTTFQRTIWMKAATASSPSGIDLALPAGAVKVTVAGRDVARLETRRGECP